MKVGDPIVYPVKGSREIMIGQITGPYRWAGDDRELVENDYSNVRPVKWIKTVARIVLCRNPRNHCPSGAYQTS